jgi:2-dehydro-3-deoxyphosphogluconate aldolase/(4S)-4-hydroxy-2-oxoglutarate aldolase
VELKEIIIKNKIIASCRGVHGDDLIQCMEALYLGGIRLVDIAFTQGLAYSVTSNDIKKASEFFKDRIIIGTGNVLDMEQLKIAHQSGTKFIVSPDVYPELIIETKKLGMVSIPGGMTSSEITTAKRAGADMVMLFPTGWLGLEYIKNIAGDGPLSDVDYVACGGVNQKNLKDFFDCGIKVAVIGSFLADKKLIKEKKYIEITNRAKYLLSVLNE